MRKEYSYMPKKYLSNAGAAVIIILSLSFFYVYQRVQILRLGYKIRDVEKKTGILKEENSVLRFKISQLISPENIAKEVKKLGLDLGPPKEKQIIRVK